MKKSIYYIGIILGFTLGAIVMDKPPVMTCWTETVKDGSSMHRIPCPKGME